MMKIDDAFMYNMFTEHHWTTNPKPLRAPINIYARNCFFEDELLDKGILSRSESSRKGARAFPFGKPTTATSSSDYLWPQESSAVTPPPRLHRPALLWSRPVGVMCLLLFAFCVIQAYIDDLCSPNDGGSEGVKNENYKDRCQRLVSSFISFCLWMRKGKG